MKKRGGGRFGAKKTVCSRGHKHDSSTEAARCEELHQMQEAGLIEALVVHPRFKFCINGAWATLGNGQVAGYTADFGYREGSKKVVEDHKPKSKLVDSRDWPLRQAVFKACYPHLTLVVHRGGRKTSSKGT